MTALSFRELCLTCRRPRSVCWCGLISPVPSATRVVFLQHPREFRVPVSTCRMAHLSLPNSELHVGLGAAGNPRLEAVVAGPGVAVLFPSDSAVDVGSLEAPPRTLVVVDGTWSNAKKVVERCPLLSRLPRVSLRPPRPGTYRIRKEPRADFLSTIEAVTFVLETLERAPGRFAPLLAAFDGMVERQLTFVHGNRHRSRHRRAPVRSGPRPDPLAELRDVEDRLVLVFGEANAWPLDDPRAPADRTAELVQLVAVRLATGERFSTLLAPRRPLGPSVPTHLELPASAFAAAPSRDQALDRWAAFLAPGDVLAGWGTFCRTLLLREGARCEPFVDVRAVLTRAAGRRPGAVEDLGGAAPRLAGPGRALRRLAALEAVTRSALTRGARPGVNPPLPSPHQHPP